MSFTPAMSWFTSWLPELPAINISLPTSIQSRFLSFLLKKTLGHFLKPGQLDVHQIDSQIGSGYVQVADLELSNEAINELLNGMPIELHDGSIGSVIARIPWPNPLTSAVGLSLESLHLTFVLLPSSKRTSNASNLADSVASVASVAETFIHDELTPREEFKLRESFYSEHSIPDDPSVPGGLDPFITSPEYEDALPDIDPAGVSMFATLIERLLARFEFDATNTKITLMQPGRTSLTLSIADIRYRTEDRSDDEEDGKVRSVSITGITVSARNLRPAFDISSSSLSIRPVSSPTSTLQSSSSTPRCPSPTSSSSSLDEDTQIAMSQSLAFLPPRPSSPASSVASSMYQSAVSMQLEHTADIQAPPPELSDQSDLGQAKDDDAIEQDEHIILSFGPDPISLRLTTPGCSPTRENIASNENFKFSVTAGIIACSFRAWHVRSIMDIANVWTSHQRPSAPPAAETLPSSPPLAMGLEVALNVRGLIILFLPSTSPDAALARNGIAGFFERPLVPPKLPQGYLRFHVEGISCSGEISLGSTEAARSSSLKGKKNASSTSSTLSVSLDEISAFAFRSSEPSSQDAYATPILITDFHLPESYHVPHQHPNPISKCGECPELPSFDILDWTDDRHHLNGMRLSQWRTKHRHRSEKPTEPSSHPAVIMSMSQGLSPSEREKDRKFHQTNVEVKILPLHVFVDLRQILATSCMMEFLDELTTSHTSSTLDDEDRFDNDSGDEDAGDAEGDTPPATPHGGILRLKEREAERERRRLEQLVLKDLDLDFDYQTQKLPGIEQKRSARKRRTRKQQEALLSFSVKVPLVRLQVRCPPPAGSSPRSGSLILDLHDIRVANAPSRKPPSARFADETSDATEGDVLAAVEIGRIVISSSTQTIGKAAALISIGPLAASDDHEEASTSLLPRVVVTKSARTSTLALTISIPSVCVNMSKAALDGLQYWADDVTQLLEKAFGSTPISDDGDKSSIIGSRFFTQSRSGSGSETTTRASKPKQTETAVKVTIAEAFIRLALPRKSEASVPVRPLDLYASDVDILVEMKPDGKDETVVTVGIMDLTLKNTDASNAFETYLSLTAPRSLTATPQCLLRLQFTSLVIPETTAKESRIKISLWGFTFKLYPNIGWTTDIAEFVKAPPGAFESVIPSERTRISIRISDGSINTVAPKHPGSVVVHIGDLEFGTNLVGSSSDVSFRLSVPVLALLAIDDISDIAEPNYTSSSRNGVSHWRKLGYALLAEVASLDLHFAATQRSEMKVIVDHVGLRLHLCADTLEELIAFIGDLTSAFKPPTEQQEVKPKRRPTMISEQPSSRQNLMSSIDDLAFKRVPEIGPAPDMINDDLPTNLDYLDESFSAAAGLRELRDDDLEDFDNEDTDETQTPDDQLIGIVSKVGGETIKMLRPEGIHSVEHYFDSLQPEPMDGQMELGGRTMRIQLIDADINVFLYGGYDWAKTRRAIEEGVKEMRKRLAKIRQLVASGQTQDTLEDETSALLFNSVYIGLDQDADELEPGALIAAIDEELKDDYETASQSSWQSLKPSAVGKTQIKAARVHGKRLTRAKGPSIEFRLAGMKLSVDQYKPEEPTVSRIFSTVRDLEILDHMKTSTWNKFLTSMRSDSRGNVRETDSNMVRLELRMIHPVHGHSSEEARLKAKILPLRLHVDQDALDFLKSFFSFKDPHALPSPPKDSDDDIFFQLAEIFPIDIKMDYKPRRVDYRALKQGRTIELMNFFHFDGSEMTLRHITLAGISGWPRLFDLLNDLWTPDVKATQLVDVISGVAPIRSVVNVGSGIADLVLLPIAQYKKDGRIVRGVQKGATAFVKSTAIEAIKLGAHLATGTQVILEQAEGVLGGQFDNTIMAETLQGDEFVQYGYGDEDEAAEMISKYAEQPADIKEGVQSAYRSLHRNLNSAAQTILAVPMEVYERSGNEGPVRSVIRAVPIAVLKPMIGATEAVSKTLLGLHNTLDPNVRHDNQAKYKQR
ncbi:uncharacterized protein EV420DRAFT_1629183 [Desarmillaria tabescens]|uniref:Autophagy-related protein 2 n=1 Tax=Armillaria tabescens TaxID=1929756 RepID=A0AA39KHC4_ARMTA|nr:uncharacterized protein EV420DRAFT_1629183 [Desarmillaria tabescens]KAK0459804.1 hypothetical protein EV420DRAFT_1629183 [Desarmillaria tabescens]